MGRMNGDKIGFVWRGGLGGFVRVVFEVVDLLSAIGKRAVGLFEVFEFFDPCDLLDVVCWSCDFNVVV